MQKNRVTFVEKPNSSPQAPRPKAIAHSFFAFLMGPPRASLEHWPGLLYAPSHGRLEVGRIIGSRFEAPSWFWQNVFSN